MIYVHVAGTDYCNSHLQTLRSPEPLKLERGEEWEGQSPAGGRGEGRENIPKTITLPTSRVTHNPSSLNCG